MKKASRGALLLALVAMATVLPELWRHRRIGDTVRSLTATALS